MSASQSIMWFRLLKGAQTAPGIWLSPAFIATAAKRLKSLPSIPLQQQQFPCLTHDTMHGLSILSGLPID